MTKTVWLKWTGQILLILLITLLLLEGLTRLIWWNKTTVVLFDRPLNLLPLPLLTAEQAQTLTAWSQNGDNYVRFDPLLGWSHTPGVSTELAGVRFTANSIGVRSLREYAPEPPPGIIRLAAFGPSFTHGDEVTDQETWAAQLEQARPEVEVMNWGVGGYGTDQAFLTYQSKGAVYRPQVVIIGIEEENPARNVNRFRPFYRAGTGLPLTKPLFIPGPAGLTLLENPFATFADFYQTVLNEPERFLAQVCPHDFFCDPAQYETRPFDFLASYRFARTLAFEIGRQPPAVDLESSTYPMTVTLQLVQLFIETVGRNGAVPVILIFPEMATLYAYDAGKLPPYHLGVVTLRDQGVLVIDLAGALAEARKARDLDYQDFFASEGGHYNALGNEVVAQTLLWHLCGAGIVTGCP
jgi:hypothetical protein